MTTKGYLLATAVLFSVIAVLHVLRIVYRWPVSIDGWSPDLWVSWAGVVLAGFLAWQGFRLARV